MKMERLLYDLLSVPTQSRHCEKMIAFLKKVCPSAVEDTHGNLFITQGKPPYACAVAHMDTVHSYKNLIVPMEFPSIVLGIKTVCITGMDPETLKQTGIGGDDKCGIYACLKLLEYIKNMKVAFFVDEECGCIGSGNADLEFFKDCRFILQADRRGHDDFVDRIGGDISSVEFKKAVKPYIKGRGFKFCNGMMTDVMKLNDRKVGISCANMSAGYHRPHSDDEYIVLSQLENTIYLMWQLCSQLTDTYPFLPEEKTYTGYFQRPPASGLYARGDRDEAWEHYAEYWQHLKGTADPPQPESGKSGKKPIYHKWFRGVVQPKVEEEGEEGEVVIEKEKEKVDDAEKQQQELRLLLKEK